MAETVRILPRYSVKDAVNVHAATEGMPWKLVEFPPGSGELNLAPCVPLGDRCRCVILSGKFVAR